MNQHGYGYGVPYGYPPGITPASELGAGQSTAYAPGANIGSNSKNHEEAAKQSFEQNRNVIPGLGLNFSSNAPLHYKPVAGSATQTLQPNPPPSDLPQQNSGQDLEDIVNGNHNATLDNPFQTSRGLEEGELSDGEMEDFYEPREPDSEGLSPYDPTQPLGPQICNQHIIEPDHLHGRQFAGSATGNTVTDPTARERSGSYSPYLSPREMTSAQSVGSPSSAQDASFSPPKEGGPGPTATEKLASQSTHGSGGLPTQTLAQARRAAEEAISSLWPYNIRFTDYISEGIDASVLRDLFTSLGLSTDGSYTEENGATSRDDPPREVLDQQKPPTSTTADQLSTPKPSSTLAIDTDDTSRKTEERKDRIARLLAAKATKPAAPPSTDTNSNAANTPPLKVTSSKTQSEKSKILQQKMEALRKAREARAKETAESQNSTDVYETVTNTKDDAATEGPKLDGLPRDTLEAVSDNSEPIDDAEDQAASSIPGLFLSSTPQPGSVVSVQKRPVASDFDHISSGSSKRPFGQKRDSQPFLIDVSDDEDDAEMEIDSPELRPATLHLPPTPSRTILSREAQQQSSNSHHVASPSAAATPSQGSSGGIQGRPDLESMNKKIEEMKRKIAEAEARKRAKQSQNGSMTPSLPINFSDVDTPGLTPNASQPGLQPTTAASIDGKPRGFDVSQALHVAKRSESVGQRKEDRIMRSRVASERISLIEAHRRQQLLKLQALKSQVANIEKELEESRVEEERLMQEVGTISEPDINSEPRSDVVPTDPTPLALPSDQASPADAVETSAHSSMDTDATDTDEGALMAVRQEVTSDADATMSGLESEQQAPEDAEIPEPLVDALSTEPGEALPELLTSQDEQNTVMTQLGPEMPTVDMDTAQFEGSEDMSDDYEPPEAGSTTTMSHSPQPAADDDSPSSPKGLLLATDEKEEQGSPVAPAPALQKISLGERDITPDSPPKMNDAVAVPPQRLSRPHPEPYETPLRYFRAYRFHPLYKESVPGGIRSLTYSNKVDVQKALCPDQQIGQECPRGNACQFQHFESMQVSDSQIVTVLTEYGNFEADEKQRYISGLRDLLTDLRNRKVKDLDAISQGIIEFRAQFLGDRSRVLPLGSVSL